MGLSSHQGSSTASLEGLPSQGSTGKCPLLMDARFETGGAEAWVREKGNKQQAGTVATPVRNPRESPFRKR